MFGWIKKSIEGFKEYRKKKALEHLSRLKWRYNIFRSLLYKNSKAVDIITDIDMKLRQQGILWSDLHPKVNELIEISYEMIEMLNKIDNNRHELLINKHRSIKDNIEKLLKDIPHEDKLPFCVELDVVSYKYRSLAGGKASALSFLKNSGVDVPDGFVVLVNACRMFLEETSLSSMIIKELQPLLLHNKEISKEVELKIKNAILEASIPSSLEDALMRASSKIFEKGSALAVRSSGLSEDTKHTSFAGQFKSFLNVRSFEELKRAFKGVIASNFTARSIAYRMSINMRPFDFDMAVLCVEMIDAHKSGVLFTLDPNYPQNNIMLITAIWGMGELLVSGKVMSDVYKIKRPKDNEIQKIECEKIIASKDIQLRPGIRGGLVEEEVPSELKETPVLLDEEIKKLTSIGLKIENLYGKAPQDIEWVIDAKGKVWVVQTRPVLIRRNIQDSKDDFFEREILFEGGIIAARGRAVGVVQKIYSREELNSLADKPYILLLRRSFVDAARVMNKVKGVVVSYGNPADHLSCVAREFGRPMLVGVGDFIDKLEDGDWIVVDGNRGKIYRAEKEEIQETLEKTQDENIKLLDKGKNFSSDNRLLVGFREYTVKLNLTDAYGPSFSILECKSLHDIVRYVHEKAVLSMFEASDEVLEGASSFVYKLQTELPVFFRLIDIGGGISSRVKDKGLVSVEDVESRPFRALWKGISTPGLRWAGPPPVVGGLNSVVGNWMSDTRSGRTLGMPNYVIVAREYLNLNARMDFHFAMIDAVCALEERLNYIRFRFKGGGTSTVQRHRRVLAIGNILESVDFYTDIRGDLINAVFESAPLEDVEERLCILGRLLGFTRLIDAAMIDESSPALVAEAFFKGDYGLTTIFPKKNTSIN